MDWVLNNLENVIIPVIIAVLYLMGNAAQKKSKKDHQGQQKKPGGQEADPDEARRISEIQEEIRRKIAERTGRTPPPPQTSSSRPTPPPIQKPISYGERKSSPKPPQKFPQRTVQPVQRKVTPPAFRTDTYQRDIEAKMKKVRELEAQVKKVPVSGEWGAGTTRKKTPKGHLRKELFRDLAHPLGQKKAILVSEILGSPVGVKGPSGWKFNV